jgi:hypothetical protein
MKLNCKTKDHRKCGLVLETIQNEVLIKMESAARNYGPQVPALAFDRIICRIPEKNELD